MKKIVKLTESQLYDIVKKVLKEQAQQTPTVYGETSFKPKNYGSYFDVGQYEDTNGKIKQSIESDKEALINFINSQDFANFTAKIIAGESQITNPAQFKQKGSLALARAKTVNTILKDVYSDLITSGRLKVVIPTIQEVIIGKTPYKSSELVANCGANREKMNTVECQNFLKPYRNEQYVSMKLTGVGKTLRCNKPLPVKGSKGQAPNFEFIYGEELRLNPKIKGIKYEAYTIPDRPIIVNANGEKSSPPYFVREKRAEANKELRFPLELAVKNHLYSSSEAFANVELDNSGYKSIVTYLKGGVGAQQIVGATLVNIFKGVADSLTPELKKLNDDLIASNNTLTVEVFNPNAAVLKNVFSKTPRIVTNSSGTPFNVNMQQTSSIKVGSYAPLENTVFAITPFC